MGFESELCAAGNNQVFSKEVQRPTEVVEPVMACCPIDPGEVEVAVAEVAEVPVEVVAVAIDRTELSRILRTWQSVV